MELGLFQLENLFLNPNTFLFVDLRAERMPGQKLDHLLSKARGVRPVELRKFLDEQRIPKERPIVLVCGDGRESAAAAADLEAAGYDQIYVVAGGVSGLLSEI